MMDISGPEICYIEAKSLLGVVYGCESRISIHQREREGNSFIFELIAENWGATKSAIFSGNEVYGNGNKKKTTGEWYLDPDAGKRLSDILKSLPKHANIIFSVYLDGGTNEDVLIANLHHDKLYVTAHFKKDLKEVRRVFLLDSRVVGHGNKFRFTK